MIAIKVNGKRHEVDVAPSLYRWRPGNTEWQYKTVVSKKPPERWLVDRLEAIDLRGKARVIKIGIRDREAQLVKNPKAWVLLRDESKDELFGFIMSAISYEGQ